MLCPNEYIFFFVNWNGHIVDLEMVRAYQQISNQILQESLTEDKVIELQSSLEELASQVGKILQVDSSLPELQVTFK